MIKVKRKRYLTDDRGKRVGVILDMKTFEKMQDDLDDYYCGKAYDEAKPLTDAEIKRGEFVTLSEMVAERQKRKQRSSNGKRR